MNDKLQLFEDQPIRTVWDNENEEWYFSIVDVVQVLTDSKNPNAYYKEAVLPVRKDVRSIFSREHETN